MWLTYRMALFPIPLNDLEGDFCCLKPFYILYLVKDSTRLLEYVYTWVGKPHGL